MRLRELRAAAGALLVLAALAACSANADPTPSASLSGSVPTASGVPTISASADPDVSQYTSTIAYVKGDSIKVSDTPGGPTTSTVKAKDVLTVPDQTPLVMLVKTVQKDGIEVYGSDVVAVDLVSFHVGRNASVMASCLGWVPASDDQKVA